MTCGEERDQVHADRKLMFTEHDRAAKQKMYPQAPNCLVYNVMHPLLQTDVER